MRHLITGFTSALIIIGACLPAHAQMPGQDKVPAGQPAKTCCKNGIPRAWPEYNKGVVWLKSIEEAQAVAREKKKPIILFQMVGDMDKEGC